MTKPIEAAKPRKVVLVCGGRDYIDGATVRRVLGEKLRGATLVVHGGASGADTIAGAFAAEFGIPVKSYEPEWTKYGLSAGPKRNALMLRYESPDLVVSFPGGSGTADMVSRARRAHVEVHEVAPRRSRIRGAALYEQLIVAFAIWTNCADPKEREARLESDLADELRNAMNDLWLGNHMSNEEKLDLAELSGDLYALSDSESFLENEHDKGRHRRIFEALARDPVDRNRWRAEIVKAIDPSLSLRERCRRRADAYAGLGYNLVAETFRRLADGP